MGMGLGPRRLGGFWRSGSSQLSEVKTAAETRRLLPAPCRMNPPVPLLHPQRHLLFPTKPLAAASRIDHRLALAKSLVLVGFPVFIVASFLG